MIVAQEERSDRVDDPRPAGLTMDELRAFSRVSGVRTLLTIVVIYAWIAASFALPLVLGSWWAVAIAAVFMARHQKALGTLAHDGAHRRLFQNRRLNDVVTQVVLSSPIHLVADGYRKTHLKHHRAPLAPDDPDIGITGGYPITPRSFARKLFRDLTGQTWVKFVRHFFRPHTRTRPQAEVQLSKGDRERLPKWLVFGSMLAWNVGLIAGFALAGWWWLPLVAWYLPQVTLLQLLLRIRGIAEHAGYEPDDDQTRNTRTVTSRLQAWWFAPNHINFHIEHHLYPSVPCFRLRRVHRLLRERRALPPERVYRGYGAVIRELVRA